MAAVQVGTPLRPHALPCLACTVTQNEDTFCGPPFRGLLPAADTFLPNLATRRSRGVEHGDVVSVRVRVLHHTAHSASIVLAVWSCIAGLRLKSEHRDTKDPPLLHLVVSFLSPEPN